MSITLRPLERQRSQPSDHDVPESQQDASPAPDGGLAAWLVIVGVFGLTMVSGGYFVAWGTFQAYYESTYLKNSTSSAIAWIGSLQYALIFLPGLLSGRLFDLGYFKSVLISGSIAMTVANFMVAECTAYYQFLLAQGLLLGLAAGLMYIPCIALVSHWFHRKRPLVLSIVSIAAAVGGVIYPIMFHRLEPVIGFRWTMRTFAFFNMVFCVIAIITMKTRTPPAKNLPKIYELRGIIMNPVYATYVFSNFVAYLGLFTPLTFINVEAEEIGFSTSTAFYMVAIANGVTILGRLAFGASAIKYGALNLTIVSTICVLALTYAWAFVTSRPGYIVLSCIYGFAAGGFLGLFPAPVAQIGLVNDLGRRTGLQMTIMSIGALIGPPISGAIRDNSPNYHNVSIYAGTTLVVSVGFMALSKYLLLGKVFSGKF